MKDKTALTLLIEELIELKAAALNVAETARINKQDSAGADAMFVAYSIALKEAFKQLPTEYGQHAKTFFHGERSQTGDFRLFFGEIYEQSK